MKNDLGLKLDFFSRLNHLIIDTVFAEFLFILMYLNKVPIIIDSSGVHLQALLSLITSHPEIVSASSYLSDLKL